MAVMDTLIMATAADYTEQLQKYTETVLKMKKKEKKPIPIRGLMIDDWVMVDGRPQQVTSFAAKLFTDDGEYFQSAVYGIELDDDDARIIVDKVCRYNSNIRIGFRTGAYCEYYLDAMNAEQGRDLKAISKPVRYYHEVQHALREVGCLLGLNYRWKEREKEDKQNVEETDNGSGFEN